MDVYVLGRDDVGVVAEYREPNRKPFRYYLTECCGASATGIEDGTACRNCYNLVDPLLGGCPDQIVRWAPNTGTSFTPKPLELIDVYGDGIPYDDWKARLAS